MSVRLSILLLAAMVAVGCDNGSKETRHASAWQWNRTEICGHTYIRCDRGIAHDPDCTNHAPTVVTQYVDRVVTQECTRQHCDEPRNQWLGDGKIVTNDVGVEK